MHSQHFEIKVTIEIALCYCVVLDTVLSNSFSYVGELISHMNIANVK